MRSIIHEAASIAKAIEQGWIKAGKPRNFSIKIFEEPQTKFFGLFTARNAKVGIFIEDRKPQQQDHRSGGRKHAPARRRFQHRYERPHNPQQQGPQAQQKRPEQPRNEPQNPHINDDSDTHHE